MKTQLSSDEIVDLYNSYYKSLQFNHRVNVNNITNKNQIQMMNFIKLYAKKKTN